MSSFRFIERGRSSEVHVTICLTPMKIQDQKVSYDITATTKDGDFQMFSLGKIVMESSNEGDMKYTLTVNKAVVGSEERLGELSDWVEKNAETIAVDAVRKMDGFYLSSPIEGYSLDSNEMIISTEKQRQKFEPSPITKDVPNVRGPRRGQQRTIDTDNFFDIDTKDVNLYKIEASYSYITSSDEATQSTYYVVYNVSAWALRLKGYTEVGKVYATYGGTLNSLSRTAENLHDRMNWVVNFFPNSELVKKNTKGDPDFEMKLKKWFSDNTESFLLDAVNRLEEYDKISEKKFNIPLKNSYVKLD